MDEKALYKISYGLFVLSAREGEKDNGCIINTVSQVTAIPNRISITIEKSNYTHDMIMRTRKFNVSVLSESASFAMFERFGFQSGRNVDKFAGFMNVERSENGLLYLTEGTNAYLSGKVEEILDLDTHTLFIASLEDMQILNEVPSTTYAYYHANIKPKQEKVAVLEPGKTVWRCTICGYEYVGEELPEDYICPICKHPASDFEKVS